MHFLDAVVFFFLCPIFLYTILCPQKVFEYYTKLATVCSSISPLHPCMKGDLVIFLIMSQTAWASTEFLLFQQVWSSLLAYFGHSTFLINIHAFESGHLLIAVKFNPLPPIHSYFPII